MNEYPSIIIRMRDFFKDFISSRAAVMYLFKIMPHKVSHIIFDFVDIQFISRSATHQLLKEKANFEKKNNLPIDFINVCDNVQQMIDLVTNSIITPWRSNYEIEELNYSDDLIIEH